MGIVKIRHQGAGDRNHAQRRYQTFTLNELMLEEILLLGKDPGDDLDDSELGELGCEYAMLEDQICNVPYELYDLPDLKEILSLETWNSSLTEEERFCLAAYLPDMDQEMFGLTIRELLSGDNMFFGSPLEELFHRLKGGFYSLQVTHFREGLHFLQKQGYYHSLRSYHDSMVQKFMDMRRAWSNCEPSTSVEERVQIWNDRRYRKPVFFVDLNAFPADEELLKTCDKKVANTPMLKKKKFMNEGLNTHSPTVDLNSVTLKTKTKAKGVLKIKPIEMNSVQNHIVQPSPSDSREPCRRPPKGVLKIKPKIDSLGQLERPIMIQIPSEKTSAGLLDVHTSRFSPPQFSFKWHEESVGQNLPFLHKTDSDGNAYASPELPDDHQREEFLNMGVGPFNNSQNSQRKIKTVKGSVDLYPFAPENHQRLIRPVYPIVSEAISRISTFGTDKHRKFPKYSDHFEHRHRDQGDGGLSMPSVHTAVSRVERALMFPITYKRKKAFAKLNPVDSLKKPSMLANLESILPSRRDCHLIEKAKAVKIKSQGLE